MLKKVIWSITLIAIVGVLTYGAVNRTLAKTNDTDARSETTSIASNHEQGTEVASGQGWGRGRGEIAHEEAEHAASGEDTGQGYGRQNQNATAESQQGQGNGRGQNRQVEQDHESFGEAEQIGQGYGRQNQNTTGESQAVQGNGQGRNRQTEQAAAAVAEAEHADMDWQTVQGEVVSLASDEMLVSTASGATVVVEGQPWSYAQQAGFTAELGDEITVNGFEEDGEFKVGELMNDASGQLIVLRELGGRPMWAGQGQGKNRN